MPRRPHLREVLFEFTPRGKTIRVCAIDPDTNTEVTLVGDPRYGITHLKSLAVRKLRYVLNRKARKEAEKARKDPGEDDGSTDILA